MDITDILRSEHRLHSHLLDGFEALLDRADHEATLDVELVRMLLDFCARAMDGLHQDKEERVLFPRLIASAGRPCLDEIERLEAHHARDRRLLDSLRIQVERASASSARLEIFVTQARAYVGFQRRHMLEENDHVLPLVSRTLTTPDDRAVRAGFRRVEHEHGIAFEPEARRILAELRLQLGEFAPSATSQKLAFQTTGERKTRAFG